MEGKQMGKYEKNYIKDINRKGKKEKKFIELGDYSWLMFLRS